MTVGAQQVGQQVGVGSVALGAVAAIARAAGLDGVGVDREDLVTGLEQGVDDQARGALDGDTHVCAVARQPAQHLGQAVAIVVDGKALEHVPGGIDGAHRMHGRGPVQAGEDISTHGQTPWSCGMTARVGRRDGELIDRRSSCEGVALHPVARCGLPAPYGAAGLMRAFERRAPQAVTARARKSLTPSAAPLSGVNAREDAQ